MSLTEQQQVAADEPTWDGRVHSYRPSADWRERLAPELVLHDEVDEELDPITFEVIRHRLWTINLAHGETVTRVSGSPVFQSLDFNMCILAEDGEYIVNAPFIQFLNGGAGLGVQFVMERYGADPGIEDGDVFVGNDPWVCAVHEMDVLFACPVFVDGKLFAWTANAGHQYDLGGTVPGGWPQNAPDVFSDPTVFTPFKIVERGRMRSDLEVMYLRQSRFPEMVALDMRAQIAGCRYAADQIKEMCTQFGSATVKAAMRRILDTSQRAMQEKLERIPDGTWSAVRYVDERLPGDRGTYRVQVNVTKRGDRLIFDNDGTENQMEGPLGITFASFSGSALSPLTVTMLHEQLFAVGGASRQVDLRPTPGRLTCVDHPAAVGAGVLNVTGHIAAVQTCINRMLACDPKLAKDIVAASPDYPVPVVTGRDDTGRYYGQAILDHFAMGLGARSWQDGVDTGGPAWSPLTFLLNVEAVEQFYPLVYLWRRELPDSGGAGRWRGGTGFSYAWMPYRAETMGLANFGGGMSSSAFCAEGVMGGYPSPAAYLRVLRDTNVHELFAARTMPNAIAGLMAAETLWRPSKGNEIPIGMSDVMESAIMGGGGYADPLEREPWRVARDVAEGHVSPAAAEQVYGVLLGTGAEADEAATLARRDAIRVERAGWTPAAERFGPAPAVDAVPATGQPDREVHEALLARDADGERVLACRRCQTVLCGYAADFKRHALVHEGPVTAVAGFTVDPRERLDDEIVLRRVCCPGCQTLLTIEVARAGDAPWADMRLAP
jgi:N-methylhydantoinase B